MNISLAEARDWAGVFMVPASSPRVLSPRFRRVSFHVMARLDFIDEDSPDIDGELLRSIRARRGGTLLNLDRQLLHSAPLARGWNSLMGAIRGQTLLSGALRELVILRVAVLNRAPYEFAQHAPVALAEGVSQAQVDAVRDWQGSARFDACERDVLAYTDAMTLQVQVPQPLFDALRSHLSDREVVELTATVASYNMVSRFLEALQIEIES
jgi:alkylhydroperoxidase family enzyme